jgi:hypothetical protein
MKESNINDSTSLEAQNLRQTQEQLSILNLGDLQNLEVDPTINQLPEIPNQFLLNQEDQILMEEIEISQNPSLNGSNFNSYSTGQLPKDLKQINTESLINSKNDNSQNQLNIIDNFHQNLIEKFASNQQNENTNAFLQSAFNFEEASEDIYDSLRFSQTQESQASIQYQKIKEFEESIIPKTEIPTLEVDLEEHNQTQLKISNQRASIAYQTIDKISKLLPLGAANQVKDAYRTQGVSYTNYQKLNQITCNYNTNTPLVLSNTDRIIKTLITRTGTCDDFAYLGTYLLSREIYKKKQLGEDQNWGPVYLCQIPGHTFMLLGDLNDPNCVVVDSWVTDPHPHLLDAARLENKINDFHKNIREIKFEEEFQAQEINMDLINEFLNKYKVNSYDLT